MNEEIFDIVNDRDEVIGQLPRRIVHADGHKHRAVHVLIFNSRGQVFLQKRSMSKDTFPGAWDSSASGHLDHGEDYDACAVREVREELGVALTTPLKRLFKVAACQRPSRSSSGPIEAKPKARFLCIPKKSEGIGSTPRR